MFPDVLRKIFIINAPSFIQLIWTAISPCLAKQTLQKIEFLGDNWKERLRVSSRKQIIVIQFGVKENLKISEYRNQRITSNEL